jgi:uncharacterized protein YwgA
MKVKSLFAGDVRDIPKLSVKDWTLILIYNGGENKPKDALTIMNEIFIFTQEVLPQINNEFEFKSTIGCPYSKKVADSLSKLISSNMLKNSEDEEKSLVFNKYNLTEEGRTRAEKIKMSISQGFKDNMEFMNATLSLMGSNGMTQYIYSMYPEYIFINGGGENIV